MKRIITVGIFIVVLISLTIGAMASVPGVINYQGRLMQPSGVPVADGVYSMQFAIYDTPSGGTALWSETNSSVQVKGGIFSVLLGSATNLPANIFDSPGRFFGVKVGNDPEMTPRQQMATVPFAVRAERAGTVDDGAVTASKIGDGAVTSGKLAVASITTDKIADLAVTTSQIADSGVTTTKVAYGAITTAKISDGAVTGQKIADGAVGATAISPGAIALGYAKVTSNFSTTSSTAVQVPGWSVSVNVPTGGRLIKITVSCNSIVNTLGGYGILSLWDGEVNVGTRIGNVTMMGSANQEIPATILAIMPASPGPKTFNVGLRCVGGEALVQMYPEFPGIILVEAI